MTEREIREEQEIIKAELISVRTMVKMKDELDSVKELLVAYRLEARSYKEMYERALEFKKKYDELIYHDNGEETTLIAAHVGTHEVICKILGVEK